MDEINDRPPDPFIRDRAGASIGQTLSGLWGDSDRRGCRRLYLTTRLDYFVEFSLDHVVAVESIPPGEAPFEGLDATRVTLTKDAVLDWVRRQSGGEDPFALEALRASNATVQPQFTETWEANCPAITKHFGESDFDPCNGGGGGGGGGGTFGPWPTAGGRTCQTCNDGTCVTCDHGTCVTCAGGTCVTCEGPGCETANTCWTCGRQTCQGCTEQTCVSCGWTCTQTCDGTCASCNATCDASCQGTCRGTCDTTCAGTCQETCADTCFTCAGTCQATCDTCWTCFLSCGHCDTNPGWCLIRR